MPNPSPDEKAGLQRLATALASSQRIDHLIKQKPDTVARTAAFCRLIRPLDMYTDVAARHPEWGHCGQIQAKLLRIRRTIPGVPKRLSMSPYQIAQAYLASIPEHYRRPREP